MDLFTKHFDRLMGESGRAESVDHLFKSDPILAGSRHESRADWLMRDRSVVIEVKELLNDQLTQLAETVWPYAAEVGKPHGYIHVDEVIMAHPRGSELSVKLDEIITGVLRGGIEAANGQIRATKRVLRLTTAVGLLLVFNSSNVVLSPRHIEIAVQRQLLRTPKGRRERCRRFEAINAIAVISPHLESVDPKSPGSIPCITVNTGSPASLRASSVVSEIIAIINNAYGLSGKPTMVSPAGIAQLPIRPRQGSPVIAPAGTDPAEILKAIEADKVRRPPPTVRSR